MSDPNIPLRPQGTGQFPCSQSKPVWKLEEPEIDIPILEGIEAIEFQEFVDEMVLDFMKYHDLSIYELRQAGRQKKLEVESKNKIDKSTNAEEESDKSDTLDDSENTHEVPEHLSSDSLLDHHEESYDDDLNDEDDWEYV